MEKTWKYSLFMKNPKERAGVMSRLSFCWMNSIMKIGSKRVLDACDLYPILDEDRSKELTEKLDHTWSEEVHNSHLKGREARLTRSLMKIVSWSEYAMLIFSLFIGIACNLLQPLLLGLLLSELLSSSDYRGDPWVYLFSGGLCISSLLRSIVMNQFHAKAQLLGMRWRSATIGLIYKKALRVRQKEMSNFSTNYVLDLIARDCQWFQQIILKIGFITQGVLEIITVTAFLWQLVDLPAITGMVVIVALIGYYIGMWDVCVKLRASIRYWLDKRMEIIKNIVCNLRCVKMNGWEWLYKDRALKYRRKEMKVVSQKSAILASFATLLYTSTTVAIFVSLTTLAVTNVQLNVYTIFLTVVLIRMVRLSSSSLFASAVNFVGEYSASVSRIQAFLHEEESHPTTTMSKPEKLKRSIKSRSFLDLTKTEMSEFISKEDVNKIQSTIKKAGSHLDVRVYNEEFANNILGQEEIPSTFVSSSNVTCYWNGENRPPALQNLTFRANTKELTLINGPPGCGKSSLLATILGELPPLEGSIIHEGTIAYVPQNPVIFTESFRNNIIFGKDFNPFRYQAVINACNLQKLVDKLPDGDLTIIGSQAVKLTNGQRARIGLARAAYADADIYLLDDPLRFVHPKTAEQVFDKCICGLLSKRLRIMVSRQLQYVERADQILTMRGGTIINEVTSPMMGFKPAKLHGVGYGGRIKELEKSSSLSSNDESDVVSLGPNEGPLDSDTAVPTVKWQTYWRFFNIGMWKPLIFLCLPLFLFIQVALIAPDVWLLYISHTDNNLMTSDQTWYSYALLVVTSFIFVILRASIFISTILKSSEQLHSHLIDAILKGPADYFVKNSRETMLQCFSKEMSSMDEILPGVFLDALQGVLFTISSVVLPSILNPLICLFAIPLALVFVAYWDYYLKTSRQIKQLENIHRVPVNKHFVEMLDGQVVIRTHGMQSEFTEDIYRHQDCFSQAYCSAITCEAWIGLRMDILCTMFLAIVVFGAHLMNLGPALTGISLVYTIQLACELSVYGVRRCFDVDTYMNSVQRIMDLLKIEPEQGYNVPTQPHEPWPSAGQISFKNVSMTYKKAEKKALKDINIFIQPREKIGIVGRNGTGKSSLINCLFRMPEIEGHVFIDDIDTKVINLQRMRRGISVITKDPVIFCGNVRSNVDPFERYTDRQIWEVLEKTHIRAWVEALPKQLYQDMAECCSSLGSSEKQLFAIARALLYNTKILVMDDATACVDYKTDRLIQELIRTKFKNSTVITIPYRLSTIIDYDRVIVMDNGHITEFDKPEKLLKKADGLFAHLYTSQCAM